MKMKSGRLLTGISAASLNAGDATLCEIFTFP